MIKVSNYLETLQGAVVWQPIFKHIAFNWELTDIVALLGKLDSAKVLQNQDDRKVWAANPNGTFTVSSCMQFFW